jgi:hypothetical protein
MVPSGASMGVLGGGIEARSLMVVGDLHVGAQHGALTGSVIRSRKAMARA